MSALGRPRREVRRPPQPRRSQRSGGEQWTGRRIVEALRAWTDELGRAPRSYDWSPVIARAGGFSLAGAEKWEREHPRWPHHALVVSRFGSWRGALHGAGLPGPAPLEIVRRERVEIAQRLEGDLSAEELADVLGVVARTVRSYWRAGTCSRCGGPQICAHAGSCADCIPCVALRRPSAAVIVRALRRWTRETGAPPRITDWREQGGKWEREYPAWPSVGDVQARFGGWPHALRAAGLRPHRRAWMRDEILAALRAWAEQHGRAPHQGEWLAGGHEHPPASTVSNAFGSWSAALRAGGLTPARHGAWSEAEILDGLQAFARAHDRPPTSGDLRDTRDTPYPPATAVIRTFGSLRAAFARLGWHAAWTPVSDAEILDALSAYAREHGLPPTVNVWRRENRRPGASVIIAAMATGAPRWPRRSTRHSSKVSTSARSIDPRIAAAEQPPTEPGDLQTSDRHLASGHSRPRRQKTNRASRKLRVTPPTVTATK